jgi:hypothetical protein
MRNLQVFKRHRGEWIPRPTGGRDMNPGLPERVTEWLKTPFAQQLINKSVPVNGQE